MLKKKLISVAIVATTAIMSVTTAMAEPWQDNRGGPGGPQGHDMNRDCGYDRPMHQNGPQVRSHQFAPDRYPNFRQSHGNRWQQGDNLPTPYRGSHYRVNDWRDRGLPPPPSGHRWVHVKGEYILVAVASGVIANILLHR